MDVTDDVIHSDPQHRWLAALRMCVGALVLVVGWFILSAVIGGSAAHAASEPEPGEADSTGVGLLSSVVSSVIDPRAVDLEGRGGDVAESLDAVVGELPIVPEIVGEAPVHSVASPVLHTAQRVLEVVPEVADSAVENVPAAAALVTAPTKVSIAGDPPPPTTTSVSADATPDDAGTSLASSPLTPVPPSHDQPIPLASTATAGTSAGSTSAPTAVGLSGARWSPLREGVESSFGQIDRCPTSATYDSDSTPD